MAPLVRLRFPLSVVLWLPAVAMTLTELNALADPMVPEPLSCAFLVESEAAEVGSTNVPE